MCEYVPCYFRRLSVPGIRIFILGHVHGKIPPAQQGTAVHVARLQTNNNVVNSGQQKFDESFRLEKWDLMSERMFSTTIILLLLLIGR
jgi:hypothetical protein